MADYAIGDIQGCYDPLQRLLDLIDFDERRDRLWFVGDLVNRGPASLAVLRFIKALPLTPRITLGNHDLHLINLLLGSQPKLGRDDTLQDVLSASDGEALAHWLRKQSILYHDPELNIVMCHAGIAPMWDLAQAQMYALELEQLLAGPHYRDFLTHMYGNEPTFLSPNMTPTEKLRIICNYFTRMRFCDEKGHLSLTYKGTIEQAPVSLYPWYVVPDRIEISADIIFGHWAALNGQCSHPHIYALDTGCVWQGSLTALRLQDKQRFAVLGIK
jgi:bis(5'-nucleosyl)-tetraphosphatase (symmetrical)